MNTPEKTKVQKIIITPQTPETISAVFDNVAKLIDHCHRLEDQVEYTIEFKKNLLTVEISGSNYW